MNALASLPSSPISTLMERRVYSIDIDDTIAAVEALFDQRGLTWAPVLDDKRAVIGVISAGDLLQFHVQGRDPGFVRAWQLCTYRPVMVEEQTSVGEVARMMIDQHIHHVVVTDAQGIAGVVSSLDFVRTFVPS